MRELWLVCWRLHDSDKWQPATNQVDFREQDAKDRAAAEARKVTKGCAMQHRVVKYTTQEMGQWKI